MKRGLCLVAPFLLSCAPALVQQRTVPTGHRDWRVVAGGADGIRYSALTQIDRSNVSKLQVAWSYDTGDAFPDSEIQCNPIVVDGVLYATSPKLRLFALDAATGKELWSFSPPSDAKVPGKLRNRGVAYWQQGDERRVFYAARAFLYAIDARTGKPAPGFGRDGRVDLREGLDRDPSTLAVGLNSPPAIYRDLVIAGSIVPEGLPSAPGDIRAYDARTGKVRWTFHTIPRPGEKGYDTWPRDAWSWAGGVNDWSGMSLDEARGLVFVPTGSASFDFYGANRLGDNLYANSLLALRADTGQRVWHFQTVRHDVWDRDLPTPPSLVTVRRRGRLVDAVAQPTKSGYVFVFERATGKPLFPIVERPLRASDVAGETLAKSQPLPTSPPPFARQDFTEDLVTDRTPAAHDTIAARWRTLRKGGPFEPPSLQGTVIFPGMDGGAEWGGAAFDPETGLLYVNANEMAWVLRLVDRDNKQGPTGGKSLYGMLCANCHREDRKGAPPEFPSLIGVAQRRTPAQLLDIVLKGNGRMPAFSFLTQDVARAVLRYVESGADEAVSDRALAANPVQLRYGIDGYNKFLDPDGYPAVKPPWGTLNAIDLDEGRIVWRVPLGEVPALADKGLRNTGSENYGGPVVTAGGLVFIAATTQDKKLRAFDKATGALLWEATLPAAGTATPAVYEAGGRQFVVIAAGGGKWRTPSGGSYVAFALP
jgi:quinoprotein glucose dehydrogenase